MPLSPGAESVSFGSALIFVLTAVLPDRHYGRIMRRILLATTSFQDTPGEHHKQLEDAGFEIVRDRGPLPEPRMLELASRGDFDGWLIGDDAITRCLPVRTPSLRRTSGRARTNASPARQKWPRRTLSPSPTGRSRWPRRIQFEGTRTRVFHEQDTTTPNEDQECR
jgi:hypothetical protein